MAGNIVQHLRGKTKNYSYKLNRGNRTKLLASKIINKFTLLFRVSVNMDALYVSVVNVATLNKL